MMGNYLLLICMEVRLLRRKYGEGVNNVFVVEDQQVWKYC